MLFLVYSRAAGYRKDSDVSDITLYGTGEIMLTWGGIVVER